jgi:hypothetical protein
MRSNQNPSGSATRGVGTRSTVDRSVMGRSVLGKLSMPQMPVEWLDSGSWRLPSGKALAEFALQAGFLAPLLFRADGLGKSAPKGTSHSEPSQSGMTGSSETAGSSGLADNLAPARSKQFGKGGGR